MFKIIKRELSVFMVVCLCINLFMATVTPSNVNAANPENDYKILVDESYANESRANLMANGFTKVNSINFKDDHVEVFRGEGNTNTIQLLRELGDEATGLVTIEFDFANISEDDRVGRTQFNLAAKTAAGESKTVMSFQYVGDQVKVKNNGSYEVLKVVPIGEKATAKIVVDTDTDKVYVGINDDELKEYPLVNAIDMDKVYSTYWTITKNEGGKLVYNVGLKLFGMKVFTGVEGDTTLGGGEDSAATDEEKTQSDLNEIVIANADSIKADFTLPAKGSNGTEFTWASDNESAIKVTTGAAITANVTRSNSDQNVKLTVTGKLNESTATKTFDVVVGKIEYKELFNESYANVSKADLMANGFKLVNNVDFKDEYVELYRQDGFTNEIKLERELGSEAKGLVAIEFDFANSSTDGGVGRGQLNLTAKDASGASKGVLSLQHVGDEVKVKMRSSGAKYDTLKVIGLNTKATGKIVVDTVTDKLYVAIDGDELKEVPNLNSWDIDYLDTIYWTLADKKPDVGVQLYSMKVLVASSDSVPDEGPVEGETVQLFDESYANVEGKLDSAWSAVGNVDFYPEYMELYRPEGDTLSRKLIRGFSEDAKGLVTLEYEFASSGTDDGVGNGQFLLRGKDSEGKGGNVIVAIRHSADEVRIQNGGGAGDADTYDLLKKVAYGEKHTIKMVVDTINDIVNVGIDDSDLKEYPIVVKDVDIESLADAYWILYQKGEEKHNGAGFGVGLRLYGMKGIAVQPSATDESRLQEDLELVKVPNRWGIKGNFTLPLLGEKGTVFNWKSDNTAAINIDNTTGMATVTRTDSHQVVKLTATGTVNGKTATKVIEVTVLKNIDDTPLEGEKDLIYLNAGRLNLAKKEIDANNILYVEAYDSLILNADKELNKEIDPVTNKTLIPPSGDIHDYYSVAPYSWPNPDTADGLPWINKDGQVNPMTRSKDTDFLRLDQMFKSLDTLNLAYYFSEDEQYINKAKEIVKAWFIDEATKVNPNVNFGQGVPGQTDGRMFGVIEWTSIGNVITTVQLLDKADLITDEELAVIDTWFTEYLNWLRTSEFGIGEKTRKNNHASNYDYQVTGIMIYLDKISEATTVLEEAKKERIAAQIEADGSQPEELKRTKSVNYTVNNLWALVRLTDLGLRFTEVDLWAYQSEEGISLKNGFEFVIPYLLGDKEWTWEQIIGGGAKSQLKNLVLPMFSRTEWMLGDKILPITLNGYENFSYKDILVYVPLDLDPPNPITLKVGGELQELEKGIKKVAGVIVVDAEEFISIIEKYTTLSEKMKKQIVSLSDQTMISVKAASGIVGTLYDWDDETRQVSLKTKNDMADSVKALIGHKIKVASIDGRIVQDDNPPENAIDDDLTTYYAVNGYSEPVVLDLGGVCKVDGVAIAYSRGSLRKASFEVEVSMNNKKWTKVTSATSSGTTEELEGYAFVPVRAKYVRIIGLGNSSSAWNSFREIQVYGERAGKPVVNDEEDDNDDSNTSGGAVNSPNRIINEIRKQIRKELEAKINSEDLDDVFDKVEKDEKTGRKRVKIKVDVAKDITDVIAKFDSSVFEKARKEGVNRVAVDAGLAVVSLGPDTLGKDGFKGDVEVKVKKVDVEDLDIKNKDVKDRIKDKVVIDFNLTVDGENKTTFNDDEPVEVTVPYTLEKAENANRVVVYYLNDNGNLDIVISGKYNPETGNVEFATNHFSKYVILEAEMTMTDLDEAKWATDYVQYLSAREIAEGVTETEFAPNMDVTRDDYIAMLVRGYGLVDEAATTTFTDIAKEHKYYAEIATAQKLGITNGIGDSQFGSNQNITREQMATMITRALSVLGKELENVIEKTAFSDDGNIASYAKESVYVMQKAGILEGMGDGTYAPKETATRAQAAKVVYHLVK